MARTLLCRALLSVTCWAAVAKALASHSLRQHGPHLHLAATESAETLAILNGHRTGNPTNFLEFLTELCDKGGFPTSKGCGEKEGRDQLYSLLGFEYLDTRLQYAANKQVHSDPSATCKFEEDSGSKQDATKIWIISVSTKNCIREIKTKLAFEEAAADVAKPWKLVSDDQSYLFFHSLKTNPNPDSKDKCPSYITAGYLQATLHSVCLQGGTQAGLFAARSSFMKWIGYYVWPRFGFDATASVEDGTNMAEFLEKESKLPNKEKALQWLQGVCHWDAPTTSCTATFQLHLVFDPQTFNEEKTHAAIKEAWKVKGDAEGVGATFPLQPGHCEKPTATSAEVAWRLLGAAVSDSDKSLNTLLTYR